MKSWTLITLTAAGALYAWAAAATPMDLPPQVCDGPAGASNPNCQLGEPEAPGTRVRGGVQRAPAVGDPGAPGTPVLRDAVVSGAPVRGLPRGVDSAVPEPGAAAVFALGAAIVAVRSRRR